MTTGLIAALLAVTLTPTSTEVVIEKDAVPTVRFAADELTNYLGRVLGAAVPLVHEPTDGKASVILGDSAWSRAAGLDAANAGLDCFYTKAEGDRLYICGKDDPRFDLPAYVAKGGSYASLMYNERATVHGVYAFLEKHAGVRFYWPDEELGVVTPRTERIEIPDGCVKTAPKCTIREPYMGGDGEWYNAKNPVENGRKKAQMWLRLRMGSYMIPCNHGTRFFKYVERFGQTHPEFFRLREDGTRQIDPAHVHLCWSNRQLREEIYRDARAYLTGQNPATRGLKAWGRNCKDRRFVDIMPDDSYQKCHCADCRKAYAARKDDENGWASDLIWGAVAEIAGRLKAEGIKGEIVNLAYYPYLSVPSVDLPNNIRVMVAEYGPWSCGDKIEVLRQYEEIRAWTEKVGQPVWIWTYPNKHGRLDIPGVPSVGTHYWAEFHNGISDAIFGLFGEAESDRAIYNYMSYQAMKGAMWEGHVDADALIAEHDRLMFGAAAPEMHAFFAVLEEKWTRGVAGRTVQTSVGPQTVPPSRHDMWTKVYDRETRESLAKLLKRAAAKVASGSLEARRMAVVKAEYLDRLNAEADRYRLHCAKVELDRRYASDDPGDAFEICWESGRRAHGRRVPIRTRVHAWKTATDLEVRFLCDEPDLDRVLIDKDRRPDDPEIWHDNGVELFVNPSGDRMTYYHLMLTSANVLTDGKNVYQSGEPTDWGWNSGAKTSVTRTAKGWDAALTIPLKAFPSFADVVPMNFCRSRAHADGSMAAMSSRESKGYHDVEDYGPVDFREGDAVTNRVTVTDFYWLPYVDARAVDPKETFVISALLCRDHALSRSFWGRMPKDKVIVSCTGGNPSEPPPEFFLRRGFRVQVDGREIPLRTEPSLGARKVLELRPTEANPRNSEGDFIRLKDGTLLLAWSRYYEGGKEENSSWDNGGCDIGARRSSDDGLTWSEKDEILVRNTAMNIMAPSFVRLDDGRIALFYILKLNPLEDRFLVRFSSDEAKTWTEPVDVTASFEPGWYVCNHARVIQLKGGRLVVPIAHHRRTSDGKEVASEASLVCVLSDDGGRTWRAGQRVDVKDAAGETVVTQEPGVIPLKDGRLMMWARTKSGSQYCGHSSDGGETWGPFGPSDLVGPCSPASIVRLSSGELLAVWNDQREHPELREGEVSRRSPLSIALSRDEGRTWAPSVTLEENLSDFLCYTAIHERPDGLLLAYCTQFERALDTLRVTFVPKEAYLK